MISVNNAQVARLKTLAEAITWEVKKAEANKRLCPDYLGEKLQEMQEIINLNVEEEG